MARRWRAWRPPGERERRWRGLGVEDAYGRRGERETRCCSRGLGDADMGRRWCAWRFPGERERRLRGWGLRTRTGGAGDRTHGAARGGRGMSTWDGGGVRGGARGTGSGRSGALGGCGGASGCGSGASERLSCGGAVGSVSAGGWCAVWGGSGSAAVCGTGPRRGARLASQEVSAGPGGPRVVPPGTWGGRGSPAPSMDLLRRGAATVAAGTGGVTVPAGGGPREALLRGRGGRVDTVPGTGGLAPGGRRGDRLERPGAAMPCAGAACARKVVARWGRVVGSSSGGGGVGGGGGGGVGGGGAGSGGDGGAGMALGSLVDNPVPPVGLGGWASCAGPGAVRLGG